MKGIFTAIIICGLFMTGANAADADNLEIVHINVRDGGSLEVHVKGTGLSNCYSDSYSQLRKFKIGGTDPDFKKQALATLLSAKSSGSKIRIIFDDSNKNCSCSQVMIQGTN